MNMIDRALARDPVVLAASSDAPRTDAIADALAAIAPSGLLAAGEALRDLRERRTVLWEAHRSAIAEHMRVPSDSNRQLVRDTEAAMHGLDPKIATARADLRRAREAYAPKFEDGARRFRPAMVEKLSQAMQLIAEVNAEIAGINLGASRCGIDLTASIMPLSLMEIGMVLERLRQ